MCFKPKLVCCAGNQRETQDHMLMHCSYTNTLWATALREMRLAWVTPQTTKDLFAPGLGHLLGKRGKNFGLWLFTVFVGRFGWRGTEEYLIILKNQ